MTNYEQNFLNACKVGDLINVRNFLKNGINIHLAGEQAFSNACISENLELMDYLLSSPELTDHSKIIAEQNVDLIGSSMRGSKEVVKKLLELPVFQEQKINNPKEHEKLVIEAFKKACSSSNKQMIKFFINELPSDDTKIVFDNLNRGLVAACGNGKLKNVKFLFDNEKTSPHLEICAYEEAALRLTVYCNYQPLIQYLLVEQSHRILVSDGLKKWISERSDISSDVKNNFNNLLKITENKESLSRALLEKTGPQIKKKKI